MAIGTDSPITPTQAPRSSTSCLGIGDYEVSMYTFSSCHVHVQKLSMMDEYQ